MARKARFTDFIPMQDELRKVKAENEQLKRALAERTGGMKECATEGCDNAATIRFERGGVGSDYCGPCYLKVQAIPHTLTTEPAAPEGRQPVALTYGQKLIAEAIEHHFGERGENYDEYEGDTTVDDVWDAFDALTRPAEQAVTDEMVEAAADEIADTAEVDFNGTIINRMDVARAALTAALAQKEEGR